MAAFADSGHDRVEVFDVPGAFELPLAALLAARSGRFAGVACLGAVDPRRDPTNFVCAETARGVMAVQLQTGVPRAFGVLTCATMEQALARAGGAECDQGRHAAEAPLRRRRCGPSSRAARLRRWPRYATAAARDRRSDRAAAIRWSPPSAASTPTSRRCGPRRQGAEARLRVHPRLKAGKVTKAL